MQPGWDNGTEVASLVMPSEELQRWTVIRAAAAAARAGLGDQAPQPVLDAIAWHAGAFGLDAGETIAAIHRARYSDPPYAWEQIAAAAGLDHTPTAVRNLRSRFSYLRRKE